MGARPTALAAHDWVKSKNPKHPAVKREAEEDWGKAERRGQNEF